MGVEKDRAPQAPGDRVEDPVARAEYSFRVAQESCVDCHEYHAVWGYALLSGVISGVDADRDILGPPFRRLAPPGARILIAGAADDRLLAMVAQAAKSQEPRMMVADRCPTPLALCRRYADTHGVRLATVMHDFVEAPAAEAADLILMHHTIGHVPSQHHRAFLRHLGQSLAGGGALVLVHRHRSRQQGWRLMQGSGFPERVIGGLAERKIPLPEDEDRFRRRLAVFALYRQPQESTAMGIDDVEALLADTGFQILERIDHERPGNRFKRIIVAGFEN